MIVGWRRTQGLRRGVLHVLYFVVNVHKRRGYGFLISVPALSPLRGLMERFLCSVWKLMGSWGMREEIDEEIFVWIGRIDRVS